MQTPHRSPPFSSEKIPQTYDEKTELGSVKLSSGGTVDYTGSVAKTDPREIALVRNIDWRLMVCVELVETLGWGLMSVCGSRRCVRCIFL